MSDVRLKAAEAYIRSIRTGEYGAAVALAPLLADDVVFDSNGPAANSKVETMSGAEQVRRRTAGRWAITEALYNARWSSPQAAGDEIRVQASFEQIGGVAPDTLAIVLAFDAGGRIRRIEQRYTPRAATPTDRIAPGVRVLIDNARMNNTPLCVAYTDEKGVPIQSFRGSVQVYSDHQLCAWIRQATGGLATAIAVHPQVSFAYRDGSQAMLFITGRARLEASDEVRQRVFESIPEVEQNHDPARRGAAMIVDIDRIQGFSTGGEPVRMSRTK